MPVTVYDLVFRRVLRRLDAERAHRISFAALRVLVAMPGGKATLRRVCRVPDMPVTAFGMRFANPLGLAAGFDKDARGIDALGALGFGFVEVGTVTAVPQPGNARPRLFRLPADRAIVNRMGFNNDGAAAVARRLRDRSARSRRREVIKVKSMLPGQHQSHFDHSRTRPRVGVNIGRSKVTPTAEVVGDYVATTRLVAPYADYLVVNVSSPNTPGLRDLQAVDTLGPLLTRVREAAHEAAGHHVPLLVKIAPDLADEDIVAVARLVTDLRLDGIVATNTTIAREHLTSPAAEVEAAGPGGMSGAPLRERSLEVLRLLREHLDQHTAIISVGGIASAADVTERLASGATLVQAYTGLVYGGPRWPQQVLRGVHRQETTR